MQFTPKFVAHSLLGTSLLVVSLLFPRLAQAQLSLSPMVIETTTNKGRAQGSIEIANPGSQPFRARVYTQPFTYNRDGSFQVLPTDPSDVSNYLQFSPRELVVEPGATRRIRLVSLLPPSLPAGEYRAVLFTESLEAISLPGQTGQIRVGVVPTIGVTVYVRHGQVFPKLGVQSARWDHLNKTIQLLVSNTGTASTRPWVMWKLQQGSQVIASSKTEPMTLITKSDRFLPLAPPNPAPQIAPGTYQLTGELQWGDANNPSKLPFSTTLTVSPSP